MKNSNYLRMFAVIIIGIISFAFYASANEQPQKQVKIKTYYVSKDSKHKIETIANLLKGVSDAQFNNEKKELTVKYDPSEINTDMIVYALDILGYDSEIIEDKEVDKISVEKKTKDATNK